MKKFEESFGIEDMKHFRELINKLIEQLEQ